MAAQHDWTRDIPPEADDSSESIWPQPLDLESLASREPAPPSFITPDWFPDGYATLLAGHGGVGKSGIALHYAVCMALALPFFGLPVAQCRVLYLSCEDRENVLHWRLSRIAAYLGIDLARLRGRLDILDLVGRDTVLWEMQARTHTDAMLTLASRVKSTQRQVIIVDGITDTFAGNENAKADVKRFVNALVALIPPVGGAVLLVGHVSKPTATNGATSEGYSGTTAWHNAVRARWYLYPEQEEGGKTGALQLELQKSNLGRGDQTLRFTWNPDAHLFVGEQSEPQSHLDRKIKEESEQEGILTALRASINAGVDVPAAISGQRTSFHVLSARPEFPASITASATDRRRFLRHLEALRQANYVVVSTVKTKHRKPQDLLIPR